MSLAEVLPAAQRLSRADKVRLIQVLAEDLGHAETVPLLQEGQTYSVWSPYDADEAAAALLELLARGESNT